MKLTLHFDTGSLAGESFALVSGALMLGRAPECEVCFPGDTDPGVSRRHALIQATPQGFYLTDLTSTNGVYRNGMPVAGVLLQDGDTIRLGSYGPQANVSVEAGSAKAPPIIRGIPPVTRLINTGLRPTSAMLEAEEPPAPISSLMFGVGAVGAFLTVLILMLSNGPVAGLAGLLAALLPAPLYLSLWLWMDRNDPEPAWALAGALAWGAGAATLVSLIMEAFFGLGFSTLLGQGSSSFIAVFVAPFVEEGAKGLGLVLLLLFLRKEFDGILDGIVYAGVIALGFACVENVEYYGKAFEKGGAIALMALFFLRGVLMPFLHAVCTAMTGIGCGVSRETQRASLRYTAPLLGYLAAVALHAFHNATASLFSQDPAGTLGVYLLIELPVFILLMVFVFTMASREARIIRQMLSQEAMRGLLTPEQVDTICSPSRRSAWLLSAGSPRRFKARQRFLQMATRLALTHWHTLNALQAENQTISAPQIPGMRNRLAALQSQI